MFHTRGTMLISLMIIVSVALGIGIVIASISIGQLQMGLWQQQSAESYNAAAACIAEDQIRLRRDSGYSGSRLTVNNATCTSTITPSGSQRTIIATGTVDTITTKIQAVVDLSGGYVTLVSWEELET